MEAMADGKYREGVFNVVLAQLLHERGVVCAPEKVLRRVERERLGELSLRYAGQGKGTNP
jgi:hypothetical protein